MKTFQVRLERSTSRATVMEITAEDEGDAKFQALTVARYVNFSECSENDPLYDVEILAEVGPPE